MDIINSLLGDEDLSQFVPALQDLTGLLEWLLRLAVYIGPLTLLVMGIIYVVFPPKEATHKAGFRTYFGMGSIPAWRFSQLVGGGVIAILGLVLTIIAMSNAGTIAGLPVSEGALAAIALIKGQIIATAIVYAVLFLVMAVLFTRDGRCRFKKLKLPFFSRLLPPEPAKEDVPAEQEEAQEEEAAGEEEVYVDESEFLPEFYQEESAPITADDIFIEGIHDQEEPEQSVF